jgi:O-glycosyl hydrolase
MTRSMLHLLLTALIVTGASLLRAQNLVTNGGFESGMTGWSNSTSGSGSGNFALESSLQYAGTKALRTYIANPGADVWNVETRGPTFTNLGTGQPVSFTFRARAASAGVKLRAVLQTTTYRQKEFTLSTAWTRYVWHHTNAETSPQLKFHYRSAGTVWIDEVSVVANPAPGTVTRISPDPSIRHQTMEGIGGALTWYSDRMLASPHRDELEEMIFDDLGLDIIRLKNWYFPTNYPASKSPASIPSSNGFRGNFNNTKRFYDMAKANGRNISVLLSSWSPPVNLKTNNDLQNGGTLKKVGGQYVYADLAQYWVDLLDNTSWTPDFLSFQNEPGWVAAHETCDFAPTQTATLAGYAEALDAIHNRIRTRPQVPVLVGPESESMTEFLTQVVPLRTRAYPGINAFHNYNIGDEAGIDGAIPRLNQIRTETTTSGRPNWMSEFSKGEFNWLDTAKVIHNTLVEANSSAYIFWKLVWGNSTSADEIIFNIDGSGNYVKGNTYYALKHFSKHISRGHQRIEVTNSGTNASVRASGYINPAGNQLTLIVLNTGGTDDVISLRFPGLTVVSATGFRTRQYDIGGFPYQSLGVVNVANDHALIKNSITTYVITLADTLNPYDPALLRVEGIQHHGDRVSVAIPAQPGHDFILWKSTTLAAGSWQQVTGTVVTESGGQLILTDPNPGTTRASYRVQRNTNL